MKRKLPLVLATTAFLLVSCNPTKDKSKLKTSKVKDADIEKVVAAASNVTDKFKASCDEAIFNVAPSYILKKKNNDIEQLAITSESEIESDQIVDRIESDEVPNALVDLSLKFQNNQDDPDMEKKYSYAQLDMDHGDEAIINEKDLAPIFSDGEEVQLLIQNMDESTLPEEVLTEINFKNLEFKAVTAKDLKLDKREFIDSENVQYAIAGTKLAQMTVSTDNYEVGINVREECQGNIEVELQNAIEEDDRIFEERMAEVKRVAEEKRLEEKRIADEKAVEAKRIADIAAADKLAKEKKVAAEKAAAERKVKEAEAKKILLANFKAAKKAEAERVAAAKIAAKEQAEADRLAKIAKAELDREAQAKAKREKIAYDVAKKQIEDERKAKKIADNKRLAEEKAKVKAEKDLRELAQNYVAPDYITTMEFLYDKAHEEPTAWHDLSVSLKKKALSKNVIATVEKHREVLKKQIELKKEAQELAKENKTKKIADQKAEMRNNALKLAEQGKQAREERELIERKKQEILSAEAKAQEAADKKAAEAKKVAAEQARLDKIAADKLAQEQEDARLMEEMMSDPTYSQQVEELIGQ